MEQQPPLVAAVNASFEMEQEDPILGGNKFQIISKHGQTNVT